MTTAWLRELDGAIELTLHVQPAAKRTEVVGAHGDAIKVSLAAPPVEGRANELLVAFIAESFGVPRRQVVIVRGHASRRKTVRIEHPSVRADAAWTRG